MFSNSRNSFSAVNVEPAPVTKPKVIKQFGRVSKFKHLKGEVMLKGKFDNLKNLSRSVTAESSPIQGNYQVANICDSLFIRKRQIDKN